MWTKKTNIYNTKIIDKNLCLTKVNKIVNINSKIKNIDNKSNTIINIINKNDDFILKNYYNSKKDLLDKDYINESKILTNSKIIFNNNKKPKKSKSEKEKSKNEKNIFSKDILNLKISNSNKNSSTKIYDCTKLIKQYYIKKNNKNDYKEDNKNNKLSDINSKKHSYRNKIVSNRNNTLNISCKGQNNKNSNKSTINTNRKFKNENNNRIFKNINIQNYKNYIINKNINYIKTNLIIFNDKIKFVKTFTKSNSNKSLSNNNINIPKVLYKPEKEINGLFIFTNEDLFIKKRLRPKKFYKIPNNYNKCITLDKLANKNKNNFNNTFNYRIKNKNHIIKLNKSISFDNKSLNNFQNN